MTSARPKLAFVSPLFLFPNDAGGKIRTTNILRGLKGGAFEILLLSPATVEQRARWAAEIDGVCDEFVPWTPVREPSKLRRGLDLLRSIPVNVVIDRTPPALRCVQGVASRRDIELIVFDFVHSSVMRPSTLRCKSLCFTHNVEAEIFLRHAEQANGPAMRWIWRSQYDKMVQFEGEALRRYDKVIAVSERDAEHFRAKYGVKAPEAIPTGVDLEHFSYAPPPGADDAGVPTVVFTGSMDSAANIGGVRFFLDSVWPEVVRRRPEARFTVVGKHPPAALVEAARRLPNVQFTGFVDDVRPFVRGAYVSVIPLQVGGGTRIKAYEAMATGSPVVSTSVGIEGLPLVPNEHFVCRDDAAGFADAVDELLGNAEARRQLSRRARDFVEARFGHLEASRKFEQICLRTLRGDAVLNA